MKMKQTLLLLAVAQGLTLGTESGAMLRAQELKQCEHVTLTATADAYTTCVSTDSRNYGKESYLKLARNNARPARKYNIYLKFDLAAEALRGREIVGLEFGINKSEGGLSGERRVNIAVVEDNAWSETAISGEFRAEHPAYTQNRTISYFTKRSTDNVRRYTIRSTPEQNSRLLETVRANLERGITELTLRLYPDEGRPDEDDKEPIYFYAREYGEKAPYLTVYYK